MNSIKKIGMAASLSMLLIAGQAGATIITNVAVAWNTVALRGNPFSVITYQTAVNGGFGYAAPQVTYVVGSPITTAPGIAIVEIPGIAMNGLSFNGFTSTINLDDYIDFVVTPAAGYALDPGRFAVASFPSVSPGLDYELRTSLDGFSTVIEANWGGGVGCCYTDLVADLTSLPLITEATTFRLYFQENDGSVGAVGSTASWPYGFRIYGGIDDAPPVTLDTGIEPETVPEPVSIALFALGLAALGYTRRQTQA